MYRKYFLGAHFFNTIYNQRKLEFLFLLPYHDIIFFPCSFIHAAILSRNKIMSLYIGIQPYI